MVRGFVYVNYNVYLCIVIMIQFSYGRGTVCFVGCSKGTCLIYYIRPLTYGGGELPLIPSGNVFPARSPLPDFLQYKGTDNISDHKIYFTFCYSPSLLYLCDYV